MKVLESTLESDWIYSCSCGDCESKLEISTSDIRFIKSYQSSIWDKGWYNDLYFVKCPVCNVRIRIEEVSEDYDTKIVPKVFAKRLRNS